MIYTRLTLNFDVTRIFHKFHKKNIHYCEYCCALFDNLSTMNLSFFKHACISCSNFEITLINLESGMPSPQPDVRHEQLTITVTDLVTVQSKTL